MVTNVGQLKRLCDDGDKDGEVWEEGRRRVCQEARGNIGFYYS